MFFKLFYLFTFVAAINCGCRNGWQQFDNKKCFKYFPSKVNYKNAINLCKAYNATLASVHSREEFVFIEDIARHYSTASGVHWVWLGGKRIKNNSTSDNDTSTVAYKSDNKLSSFKWEDESLFNYTEWRDNCPDMRKDEDCILMSIFQSRPSHWCNYKCDSNQDHVICQYMIASNNRTDQSKSNNNSTEIKDDRNQTDQTEFDEATCDIGWTLNADYCYKFFETNQTWALANTMCMKNGANLLSINSESEQMFVQNFLFTISGALEAVWLGAKRKGQKKEFIWIDNTTFGYQNWSPHEPDFRNNREECLAMNNVDEFYGLWLDAPCNVMFSVACKKKAKRTPGCSKVELLNEAQKAMQMNDFIIQLLQRISNRIEETNQSNQPKVDTNKDAVALEIKSEVDTILHSLIVTLEYFCQSCSDWPVSFRCTLSIQASTSNQKTLSIDLFIQKFEL